MVFVWNVHGYGGLCYSDAVVGVWIRVRMKSPIWVRQDKLNNVVKIKYATPTPMSTQQDMTRVWGVL